MAVKVTLRKKPISKGRQSLYLDFYPPIQINADKTTRREFLGLYIANKPKDALEKQDNKQTLLLAEQIRQKRDNEINKPEVYNQFELDQLERKEKGNISFIDYYESLMDKRTGKNYNVWFSALYYLKDFANNSLRFSDVDEKFCNDFKDYLLTTKSRQSTKKTIKQNTAHSYFNKFKATLKQAFKDGILNYDLNSRIETIKQVDTKKVFLSLEELNRLVKAECPSDLLKSAALFSALTGLRFSDIEKLKWSEIQFFEGKGYFIQFKQKKVKGEEFLPISEQAYSLLGEPTVFNDKVFPDLNYSAHLNNQLIKWAMKANVSKPITFHSFRHTYAVLQLQNGTDIYTLSKMLGHKDLKTTQVYAHVVDETKRKATNSFKIDM